MLEPVKVSHSYHTFLYIRGNLLDESICIKRLFVSVYVCHVFRPPQLFVPGGQTFLTQERGGDKHFSHTGGTNISTSWGGKHFNNMGGGQTILYHGGGGQTLLHQEG